MAMSIVVRMAEVSQPAFLFGGIQAALAALAS
jgi:hypothetical protein